MSFEGETPSGHRVALDAAAEAGGQNQGSRPMELVLVALSGCTGMDVVSILRKMKQEFTEFSITAEGERTPEHPKVYTEITLVYSLKGPALDPAKVARAISLSEEKYCSVSAMLTETKINLTYEVNGERFSL